MNNDVKTEISTILKDIENTKGKINKVIKVRKLFNKIKDNIDIIYNSKKFNKAVFQKLYDLKLEIESSPNKNKLLAIFYPDLYLVYFLTHQIIHQIIHQISSKTNIKANIKANIKTNLSL